MVARPLPVVCTFTTGLLVLALSTPVNAAPVGPGPGTQTIAAHAGLAPASVPAAAADRPLSAVGIEGNVRTAYSGRYAKFLSSFRCKRGRHYQLFGAVEQYRGGELAAMALSEDDGPTGLCSGRTQRRMMYVVIISIDPEQNDAASALWSGRGQATAVLATTKTPGSSRPPLDAAAFATVRVAPR